MKSYIRSIQEMENSVEETFYTIKFSTVEILSFHIAHVRIVGSIEFGGTINDYVHINRGESFGVK